MKNFYFWMLTLLCSTIAFGQLSENFESDITTRGWSLYQTDSSDPGFVLTTAHSQSGNASYYHNDEFVDNESTAYMVTPAYTVQSGDEFSAYVRQYYSVSYYNYSGIAISNASGDPIANPADFVEVWEAGAGFAEDSWEQVVLALDAYVGQSIYLAFVYTGDFEHEFYVDNMYIGTPCTAPVASLTTTAACDTGSYNVNVDISSLGTASSLIVSDDQGNSQTANATGVLEFGPYASGTDVTFTLADADNSSCNTALATTYLCPPDNDDCANASLISSFPHSSSEDATGATQEDFVYCGPDGSNDGVWYLIEGESAQFTINVTSTGWDAAITLLSGACGELTCIDFEDNVASNNTETISFIGQVGVNYYLNVGAYSANADLPEGAFELEITSDDIPCGSPANLAVAATTDLSTDVTWQGAADNATYDLVWGPTGFTPGAAANVTGLGTTSYTIAQLTPETTYDVYVRGNCNPGLSVWVGPVTFTTLEEGAVLAGTDCIHPINVVTLPYTTTDNTSNYEDTYSGSPGSNCGSTSGYLNGDDVVYAYTPTEDTSIKISMSPTATWSGIFVYENCGDIGTACIAGVANSNTSERVIDPLIVTGGQTYYIVISTYASPQSTGYNLAITENTCIAGSFEFNAIGACETDEYNVEIVVDNMGSLDSYEVTDSQGSEMQTITEPGTYTFGPYDQGNAVTFDFVANDLNCNFTETINYFCPAPNDECENAIEAPVNSDFSCDLVVSGSTIGATASAQEDDVVGTPNNDVWFSFEAEATSHRVTLQNIVNLDGGTTTDMAMGVYDATNGCEALVFVDDSDPNTLNLSGLTVGTTYLVRVYNWSSTVASHSFDLCIGTPPSYDYDIECGTPLEMTHCYDSNENFTWNFVSTTDEPVTIQFNAGGLEDNYDVIQIYDGDVLLWDSYNANPGGTRFDLTGTVFTAMSGSLHLSFTSDGSVTCQANSDIATWDFTVECGSEIPMVDWANLQWPADGTITTGSEFLVYGQVFEEGITEAEGAGEGITAWVGYNDEDTDPSTWTNWIPATFNLQSGNNDEYMADLGAVIPSAGTYYYATRYRLDWGPYYYGGYNSGEWDGTTNVSGVLTVEVPPGTDCSNAIAVTDLPYTTTDNTGNYVDDYNGSPGANCGSTSSYLGGDDVVYAYTATSDTSIDISLEPTSTYAGMFIYESCEDIGVECVEGGTNSGNTNEILVDDLLVTAGQTYYIVISTWAPPQSTGYTLNITENTCVGIEYTTATIDQCETGEYSVTIDITSFGSSESVIVSDDQGSAEQTLSEPGTLTFGPYTEGNTVEFSFVTDDENCNDSTSVLFFCPAANDECENAIEVPVNPDYSCDLIVSGTTLGATASAQEDDVVGTPNNDVWFEFEATNSEHRISLVNIVNLGGGGTGVDMAFGVYDASSGCDALVLVDDSDPNILNLTDLTVGTTYLIRVYNWSSTIGNHSFDVCIGTPPPPLPTEYDIECGTPLEMSYCYGSNENWGWTFTSTTAEPLTITFTAGSIEDNWDFIRLYDGADETGTLLWDSNNANPDGFRFELEGTTFTAESGVLYFAFTSDGSASCEQTSDIDTWQFTIECGGETPTPPANDECIDAIELTVGETFEEGMQTGTNVDATDSDVADPSCGSYQGGDVWYMVTVPENGVLYVETQTSGSSVTETGMAAYSGTCGDLTEMMCNSVAGEYAMISASDLTPGEVIYIRVWSNDGATGTFNISAWSDNMGVADVIGANAVKLFPNPTSSVLNIDGMEIKTVQVYSADGKLIHVKTNNNVVDTRSLSTGTYIIRLTDVEGNVVLRKFIKK